MKPKKAFEIQFNWIFVLIAGAAILIFFSSLILKQKSISQSSVNIEILKQIESIIGSASVSTDTTVPFDFPNFEIMISCNKVAVGSVSSQHQSLILFAPSAIKGNKMLTQTLAFSEPYKSTNLLYMTSLRIKYIFIGNDDLSNEIKKSVPKELSKEEYWPYDDSKIRNTNDYKVRFAFVNTNLPSGAPASLRKMPDKDVTAIKISGNSEKGAAEFYKKNGDGWQLESSSAYIGKPSLIGAIYTDSIESFECNMKNAFSKHSITTKVHKSRVEQLMIRMGQLIPARQECNQVYTNSLPYLSSIDTSSSKLAESPNMAADINVLSSASKSLAIQNRELQKFSCPMIY